MKKYVITLSERFQKGHPKAGLPTGFEAKIGTGLKIHTIRENYPFWEKRFESIDKGEGMLSIRAWTDKPYRSKQRTIVDLTRDHGIGLQKIVKRSEGVFINGIRIGSDMLARHDGLTSDDLQLWFKHVKDDTELALIHFTDFRY